ncbi:unnamed protein product [Camellia sinensis]
MKVLCALHLAMERANSLILHCSESSKLYLAITGYKILLRCEKIRNTLESCLSQIQNMVHPVMAAQLLLMKRGGNVIYAGPLGRHSHKLVEYFEAVPGVPKITEGYNPATWMLDVSSTSVEAQFDVDFAEIYANSGLYQEIRNLSRN